MQGGLSPPCNPPPQKPSSKVSRAVCKFCHFWKICHFCFYPDLPQKTWEEPCSKKHHSILVKNRNNWWNSVIILYYLGIMGSGMVKNLLNSGHQVTVWNRTTDKVNIIWFPSLSQPPAHHSFQKLSSLYKIQKAERDCKGKMKKGMKPENLGRWTIYISHLSEILRLLLNIVIFVLVAYLLNMIRLIIRILYKISYIRFGIILIEFYINFSRQEHPIDVLYVSFKTWVSQVSAYTPFHFSFTVPLSAMGVKLK